MQVSVLFLAGAGSMESLQETWEKQKRRRLKHEVYQFIKSSGKNGVRRNTIWTELAKHTLKGPFRRTDYGLARMNDIVEIDLVNEVEMFVKNANEPHEMYYRLRDSAQSAALRFTEDDFPTLSAQAKAQKRQDCSRSRSESPAQNAFQGRQPGKTPRNPVGESNVPIVDLTKQNAQESECLEIEDDSCDEQEGKILSAPNFKHLREEIEKFMIPRASSGIKLRNFSRFLRPALGSCGMKKDSFHSGKAYQFLKKHFSQILKFDTSQKGGPDNFIVHLKSGTNESCHSQPDVQEAPNAMSLMSALSAWGKPASSAPAVTLGSTAENVNQNASKKPVSSENFISLVDDDDDDSVQVTKVDRPKTCIEIPDDSDTPKPGPSSAGMIPRLPLQSTTLLNPVQLLQQDLMAQQQSILGHIGALRLPGFMQGPAAQTQGLGVPRIQSSGAAGMPVGLQNTGANSNNTFVMTSAMPGMGKSTVDVTTKAVDRQEFENKQINVRPVYVPRGQAPSGDFVNNIAKECIETLSEAHQYVTQERIEQLLCQRFQCHHIRQLGFGCIDQIPSVKELNRLVCKINAYILAFVKTRSFCTLHDLKECLREYVLNKEDFNNLKLGPLQRFPVVYEQFLFPPDIAVIPEITSMDVLDHFHNFLTRNGLWSKRLELEPFMDYLVNEYSADNAYMIGVRIRSLPLMAGVSNYTVKPNCKTVFLKEGLLKYSDALKVVLIA